MVNQLPADVRFEVALQRIEVRRHASSSDEPELEWEITASGEGEPFQVLLGVLRGRSTKVTGQAAALCIVLSAKGDARPHVDPFLLHETMGEPLYDLCRRSLEAQASHMDSSFGFATKAPEVKVRLTS